MYGPWSDPRPLRPVPSWTGARRIPQVFVERNQRLMCLRRQKFFPVKITVFLFFIFLSLQLLVSPFGVQLYWFSEVEIGGVPTVSVLSLGVFRPSILTLGRPFVPESLSHLILSLELETDIARSVLYSIPNLSVFQRQCR